MATKEDMKTWIVDYLQQVPTQSGWPKDVSKYVWDNYENELKASGNLLYT